MDVKVIVKKWGNYAEGDIIENMPESTAKACIKAGVVEDAKGEKTEVKPKTAKKK